MPIVNAVNDFGAVGDGQRETVNITVSSGSPTLTVGTAIFTSGDVGKTISVWNGSNHKNATISGFTSSTEVTLNSNFAFSATASSSDILWGTDNSAAFTGASGSWRAYARTQTDPGDIPILEIPDGNYCLDCGAGSGGIGGAMHVGVLNSVKVTGISGVAANCRLMNLANGEFRFGTDPAIRANRSLTNSGGNSARLQTAAAGGTSIFLTDPSGTDSGGATYGSRIVVGRACLLAAFDLQGLYEASFGYPPNSFFTEWNTIAAYNSGTGEITIETPLMQDYKSTYPRWGLEDTIFGADQGGPFTIWVAPDGYNNTVTLENITIDNPHHQSAIHMRHWVGNNLDMDGGPGLYPTQNDTVEVNDSVYQIGLEVDKMTNHVTWNNCTLNRLAQQSASPNRMILNGGSINTLDTARYTEANNVAFTGGATVIMGVTSYGRTDRVVLNNCTGIASFQRGGVNTDDLNGTSGSGGGGPQMDASDFFTFDNGVIKFLKTINDAGGGVGNTGQQNLTRGMPPGTWVTFDDKYFDQVTDVYEDGTYCYIRFANTTDWPFTPVVWIRTHQCPDITVRNCTGTAAVLDDLNQSPARAPIYSYSNRTYVGGPSSATGLAQSAGATVFGRIVTEKITVTVPYVGAGTLTFNDSQFKNRTYIKRSDWTASATFGSTVNMKIAGERVVRAATTATGSQTNDSLMDLTTPGEVNLTGLPAVGPVFSANVTNGETPAVTVEFIMDQGIPPPIPTAVVPLRFRMRA